MTAKAVVTQPERVKRSKYNVRTDAIGKANRTVDNVLFGSLKEAKRYQDLKLLQRAGEICFLVCDKAKLRWQLVVNGQLICIYEADFSYYEGNAAVNPRPGLIVEDAKGVKTPEYRLKKELMKAIHGIEIREV